MTRPDEVPESNAATARRKTESRWGAALAILLAVPLQLSLPRSVTPPIAWVFLALALVLLVILLAANPRRLSSEERSVRKISLGVIGCLAVANFASLISLLWQLLFDRGANGRDLIIGAAAVWFTGVIVFALVFWELDRGGPHVRALGIEQRFDFLFAQMQHDIPAPRGWVPTFVDYLYMSLTNASAFSPTDVLPLTHRAKVLMALQSITSLATIVIVGARAINILS